MTVERPQNPLEAIRARCLECMGGNDAEVRRCTARTPEVIKWRKCDPKGCFLWPYRLGATGTDRTRQAKPPTRLKCIKHECWNCMGNTYDRAKLVKECESVDCHIWPYRDGHNPNLRGVGGFKNLEQAVRGGKHAQNRRTGVGSPLSTPKTEIGE